MDTIETRSTHFVLNFPEVLLGLTGKDTSDLLQRITTVHVTHLKPKQGSLGFILSPQGKIQTYFTLWKLSENEICFETKAPDLLKKLIEAFIFTEDVSWKDYTEKKISLRLWGAQINQPFCADITKTHFAFSHETWIQFYGSTKDELLEILKKNYPYAQPKTLEEWNDYRISCLIPEEPNEINSETNPLELGFHSLLATPKGCYPGQEVIEKIISLGSPAKRLGLIEINPKKLITAPIKLLTQSGTEAGRITSLSTTHQALALIKKSALPKHSEQAYFILENSQAQVTLKKVT